MNAMDQNQNNFKDIHKDSKNLSFPLKDRQVNLSYTKTNRLITALYMVTDILDNSEPIKFKLRTLGIEILSDTRAHPKIDLEQKIQEVLYLLDITITLNMISSMNSNILKKEFYELKKSVEEYNLNLSLFDGKASLEEFLNTETEESESSFQLFESKYNKENDFKGQNPFTRIGVQKGSTLMKALSDRLPRPLENASRPIDLSVTRKSSFQVVSEKNYKDKKIIPFGPKINKENQDFDLLKKQRRFEIVRVIKDKAYELSGASITDIKNANGEALSVCSEKTLQRELVAMVSDGVLKKVGSKRWSRYFLLN